MRHTVPGSLVVLALAATATLAPVPAHAVLVEPTVVAQTSLGAGSSGCTLEGNDNDGVSVFGEDGQWTTVTGSAAGTVVDPADAADRSTLTSATTTRVRATAVGGSFRSMDVEASLSATKAADQGTASECNASAGATSGTVTGIVLQEAGWFTIDLDVRQADSDTGTVTLSRDRFGLDDTFQVRSGGGPATLQVYRPAGAYFLGHTFSLGTRSPGTVSGTLTASIRFAPAGSAVAPAAGPGRKLVTLPEQLSCAAGRADLRLSAKGKALRQVRSAVFTATGAKKVRLTKAKPGKRVSIKGLPATRAITVTGTFRLRNGRTVVVERDYLRCR